MQKTNVLCQRSFVFWGFMISRYECFDQFALIVSKRKLFEMTETPERQKQWGNNDLLLKRWYLDSSYVTKRSANSDVVTKKLSFCSEIRHTKKNIETREGFNEVTQHFHIMSENPLGFYSCSKLNICPYRIHNWVQSNAAILYIAWWSSRQGHSANPIISAVPQSGPRWLTPC